MIRSAASNTLNMVRNHSFAESELHSIPSKSFRGHRIIGSRFERKWRNRPRKGYDYVVLSTHVILPSSLTQVFASVVGERFKDHELQGGARAETENPRHLGATVFNLQNWFSDHKTVRRALKQQDLRKRLRSSIGCSDEFEVIDMLFLLFHRLR